MLRLNVLIRISVCFLFIFLPLNSMDEWFYDIYFRLQVSRMEPTNIVLIKIDDSTLISSDNKSPHIPSGYHELVDIHNHSIWYPTLYGKLLDQIEAQSPRAILFTSYYQWVDGATPQKELPDNVFLAGVLNEDNLLIPPPRSLSPVENYGFSNLFPESDNVVRKTYLSYSSGPSLTLRAYPKITDRKLSRNLLDPMWIDFRGPANSYPTYDAEELMESEISAELFKDRVILIGRSGGDEFETPHGKMSRLEIQANIIDTFTNDREIRKLPSWVTWGISGIIVALSIALILYFPLSVGWISLIGLFLFVFIATLIVFTHFKFWPGISNPIACIFSTHLVMLGYKLSRQEERQWKIQQEATLLKDMDQFKNNFISLFSHDLKTPIAKIKAVTERLLSQSQDTSIKEAAEDIRVIESSNSELEKLISDILKVTKMETMSLKPSKEVIDINRLVEHAVKRIRFIAKQKNISIVMDLEPLFAMEGDANLIQEVILNLLENAVKYSPEDRKVILRTREQDDRVYVAVIDEGRGIPAEEIPRVTGKFYRGKETGQRTKGSGLGLYLSKYFVELHNGQMEIQSELGKGTEVLFWLPIE